MEPLAIITVLVLICNAVMMVLVTKQMKDTDDWLKALDEMMEGRSRKTRCQRCGITYIRDKSNDFCPDCAELTKIPEINIPNRRW